MEGGSDTDFGLADFLAEFFDGGFEVADFLGGLGEDGDFVLADGDAGGLGRIETHASNKNFEEREELVDAAIHSLDALLLRDVVLYREDDMRGHYGFAFLSSRSSESASWCANLCERWDDSLTNGLPSLGQIGCALDAEARHSEGQEGTLRMVHRLV